MQYSHHCEHLLERLNKQREAGFLCDCTIVIGEFQFKAHRNVLASFSEYFGAIYRSTSENNVFLDQSQVKADGFQKLLEFIYTGTLNLDSWNVKEIHQAADYLKVEEVVTKCKIKMEDFAFIANPSSTEISSITGNIELNQQTCLLTLRDYNNREKSEVSTDLVQANSKRGALAKKSSQTKKKKKTFNSQKTGQNKTVQYPSDILENTSVELFLDANKLSTPVVEQVAQTNSSELELTSVVENTFPAQDIVQTVRVKRKRGKSQPNCALKEHSMSNIASIKSPYELENSGEELDQRYSKAKPTCNTCGKVFSEASSLRRHMRIHKGVKPYVCHLCGKAFTQCNQLKTHVRTHTGERPYKCELCDKGFAQKCQLVFHSRMHHGEEKPYKCDACNLQFATSSNLKIHARKHSGEKPYVCDRCGQRFAQASTLTYHVRRHTGEKPYVCDTCGKAFAVSSSLITHSRKHTGERPFICELCGNSYTDIKNLKKHKTKVHSGTDKTLDPNMEDHTLSEQDSIQKSPLSETMDVKPSDMTLPLSLPLGTEDHHMLLPVTDNQSPTSDTLLRSTVNGYSEPQLIFLQQLY
ncbi:myoneurin isoform X2 [Marmota monax]|uniref:Myoneurin n=3 Tax=Marmotini TaxID=337730 RepID=A0A8C9PCG5_SPEDA|nr:myoneurin isoform X4 [Marmota marmota marmota]XP_026250767.1 myoneurin isoform X2 [Urocitellus parryii]XP_027797980.1 myoneurin isoform X4 [Marmota flaviventris]XP_046278898.1 myoneurin isoform X2 [Marmota monax]